MTDKAFIEYAKAHQHEALIPGGALEPTAKHDYVGAAVVVRGALFFRNAADPAVRDAIAQCYEQYRAVAKDELKWLWQDGKQPVKLKSGKLPADLFTAYSDKVALTAYVTSGDTAADAGFWHFQVFGQQRWREERPHAGLNTLTFSTSLLYVAENPATFQKLFVDFARRLNAASGYAGYAVNLSLATTAANVPTEYQLAKQMIALDVGEPLLHAARLRNGIKTVGWLTALNKELLEKAGGLDTLRNELPPDWFALYDLNSGVVIQAGRRPESGSPAHDDENGPPVPPASYVILNAALKSVRVPSVWQLQVGQTGSAAPYFATTSESDDWLRRFDVPDQQLFEYKAKLLQMPVLDAEYTLPDRL
ncbi:type VI immunity family protein [Burkholderia guangdongensis]|uniref:type VI immunity family protein n=1 Tax=Burkholderia guangdongensis TaxID=1792500 RepID=UPI0015C732AB|nr:type VI immunity family protein [Burkholderia guangdongensis]